MSEVRVRFAPSPTGPFHIGGARSALFNYLFAKANNGKLIVRVEDTDVERSSKESEENILNSLKWLGIEWDEGVEAGGEYGPYHQMDRLDIYNKFVDKLFELGYAYKCYCSPEELEKEREEAMAKGGDPKYSGKCRTLSKEQEDKYIAEGRKPVIRFRVPENKDIIIDDLVRGKVVFESNGIGDFVIVKSDGIPTYNFAAAVDDYSMKISHIIRGDEHLSNTPRQVLIYEALNLKQPKFAHISLILGKDKKKMSKRHGATSVYQYMESGYLSEALVNFLALLGWSPGGEKEIFSMEELINEFSLDNVAKNPAVFDVDKLNWLNGMYIRKMPKDQIALELKKYLEKDLEGKTKEEADQWLMYVTEALYDHINTFADINKEMESFMSDDIEISQEALDIVNAEGAKEVIQLFRDKLNSLEDLEPATIKKTVKETGKELGAKGKGLFMPVRIGLTRELHGPDLSYIVPLLGKDKALNRLDTLF